MMFKTYVNEYIFRLHSLQFTIVFKLTYITTSSTSKDFKPTGSIMSVYSDKSNIGSPLNSLINLKNRIFHY